MRRISLLALLLAAVGTSISSAAGAEGRSGASTPPGSVITLAKGQARFWDGPFVDSANVPTPAACGVTGPCWEWTLRLNRPGALLRVALGMRLSHETIRLWPDSVLGVAGAAGPGDLENRFRLQLESPAGEVRELDKKRPYDGEITWEQPAAGDWLVRVIPTSAREVSFRLRALLQDAPSPPEADGVRLLPNLRIIPPFEFTFRGATNTFGPSYPTHEGKGSCMAEEYQEAVEEGTRPPIACLRFSAGLENADQGPLLLAADCVNEELSKTVFPFRGSCVETDPAHAGRTLTIQRSPLVQLFRVTDAASAGYWRCCDEYEHPAGTFRFHPSHNHSHYLDAWAFELFRVEDPSWRWPTRRSPQELRSIGTAGKFGIAPGPEKIADWRSFMPVRDCCWNDPWAIHLPPGWGDLYEYNRSGNYIDFPLDAELRPLPGTYLLRGTANPRGLLLESDYSDNAAYALVEVVRHGGSTVIRLLERGYGAAPWQDRVVLRDAP